MALTKTQVAMLSATGTADNTTFLRGDGAWATPSGGGGGGFSSWQIFASTGTFTVPTGVTKVKGTVVGGGGGGGGVGCDGSGGGGGGGGTTIEIISGLTPAATVSVTVGTGGSAGTTGNGGSGGTSSFGAYCSATGGAGGGGSTAIPGLGGLGSNGDLNIRGGTGFFTSYSSVTANGGSSFLGGAGSGAVYGGGGYGSLGSATPGGAGATGVVIVEY